MIVKCGSSQQTGNVVVQVQHVTALPAPNIDALDASTQLTALLADNPWTKRSKRQPANGNWTVTVLPMREGPDDQNQRRYADLDATITLVCKDFLAEIGITQRSA